MKIIRTVEFIIFLGAVVVSLMINLILSTNLANDRLEVQRGVIKDFADKLCLDSHLGESIDILLLDDYQIIICEDGDLKIDVDSEYYRRVN